MTIKTAHEYASAPGNRYACFDWSCIDYDRYEPGQPIGRGATEREATIDFLEQVVEKYDDEYGLRAEQLLQHLAENAL